MRQKNEKKRKMKRNIKDLEFCEKKAKKVCLSQQHLFEKIKIFDRMAEEKKRSRNYAGFYEIIMATHVCSFVNNHTHIHCVK